jgi:hypothetical protein
VNAAQIAYVAEHWEELDPRYQQEILSLLEETPVWVPQPGPQNEAFSSLADITGYGGAAGGGKTDLACGLALTQHRRSIIYRREGTQLLGITDRIAEILGTRDGYNSQKNVWRVRSKGVVPWHHHSIEFGGVPNESDKSRYQGRAHDLKVFDEVTEFLESQVRFLMGWLRSPDPAQRKRVLMTFNPPTSAEGRWVISFFGPWLDPRHPNPAEPGELRWYTTINGKDKECDGPDPIELEDGTSVEPMSRTFIPAKVQDNQFYMDSGYLRVLQALPEPLRSQMLNGDFSAGTEDDPLQVIPTAWVDAAMERWQPREQHAKEEMDSMGVDVARGGMDETIIYRRHKNWVDEALVYPGSQTPDGPTTTALIIAARRDQAVVHIDKVGWGASPFDFLLDNNVQAVGLNGAEQSKAMVEGESGLGFANMRSELYWRMREALDPDKGIGLALPPDNMLRADLCAARWMLRKRNIELEAKDKTKELLGRSPDRGDACVLALIDTMKTRQAEALFDSKDNNEFDYNPYEEL